MDILNFIRVLNQSNPLVLDVASLLIYFTIIAFTYAKWGKNCLYVFIAVATIAANIQVLKPVQYGIFSDPVGLGTVLFSTTYLCTDILSEFESPKAARTAVFLGFFGMLLWTIILMITMGYSPLTPEQAGEGWSWALPIQSQMEGLFLPIPAFFLASLFAYLISQLNDIYIYDWINKKTSGKYLWLRNNASTWISALVDNTIFSLLAFVVLAGDPLPLSVVIPTYILGTYMFRVVIAATDTPFIYLVKLLLNKKQS